MKQNMICYNCNIVLGECNVRSENYTRVGLQVERFIREYSQCEIRSGQNGGLFKRSAAGETETPEEKKKREYNENPKNFEAIRPVYCEACGCTYKNGCSTHPSNVQIPLVKPAKK